MVCLLNFSSNLLNFTYRDRETLAWVEIDYERGKEGDGNLGDEKMTLLADCSFSVSDCFLRLYRRRQLK